MAVPRHRVDGERAAQEPTAGWQSLYEIEDQGAVEAFVARHPKLEAILARAPSEIAARFDDESRPVLRVEADPEDEPASEYLVISILTRRDHDDAQARLARFDEEWWIDDALPVVGADALVALAWQ